MNDGTQPLGPILVFSKKDTAFAARLPPLGEQMESHHPQGDEEEMADRDRGVFRSVALPASRALLD